MGDHGADGRIILKINVNEIVCDGMGWIQLDQDVAVMEFCEHGNEYEFNKTRRFS